MTSTFDKLNLRPFERRLVVVVGIILFVGVQFLYIWPHFGDVSKTQNLRRKALTELKTRQEAIAETNKFNAELIKLQGEGLDVPEEDQAVELMRAIQRQAAQAGVQIQSSSKPFTRTNDFFMEQSQTISTVSEEGALVNFVYDLGSGNSLIRVRDLTLRRDQSQTRLNASIKLVASYQKKPGTGRQPPSRTTKPAPATSTSKKK